MCLPLCTQAGGGGSMAAWGGGGFTAEPGYGGNSLLHSQAGLVFAALSAACEL